MAMIAEERLKLYELWPRIGAEEAVDRAIADINVPADAEEAYWREFRVRRDLRVGGLTEDEWRAIARRRQRVEIFKEREWGGKLAAAFLDRRGGLDQVVYTLIRLRSLEEAKEIHRRLEEDPSGWEGLAGQHSCGLERHTRGLLGPSPLGSLHPQLAELLAPLAAGEWRGPTRVGEWSVLVRLEKRLPARLGDPAVRGQLLNDLFTQWLAGRTPTLPDVSLAAAADPPVDEPLPVNVPNRPAAETPFVGAEGEAEAALACLEVACRRLDLPFRRTVARRLVDNLTARKSREKLSLRPLGACAETLGLAVQWTALPIRSLAVAEPPALLRWDGRLAVLHEATATAMTLSCPERGVRTVPWTEAVSPEPVEVLLLRRGSGHLSEEAFSLRWFWPAIVRHRRALLEVLAASFFVQLFALSNPLLTQLIIDKVLVQNSLGTLHVLGLLFLGTALCGAILSGLRTYLFADTTNRIDLTLGSAVMDRLYRLTLGYFQKRPVGELAGRVNELENVRQFLTGSALTLVLDAVFSLLYIAVMLAYSVPLTLVALGAVPVLVGITLAVHPVLRRQLRRRAESYAATQSHLVETLGGIQTIKAQGLEPLARWRWQDRYARFVSAGFRAVVISTGLNTASGFLNRMADLAVLWVGAWMVIEHRLSIGQLIAFRIIAGYVSAPLLRLAGSWQQFQETALSLERLSDILDAPREEGAAGIPLPPVVGEVTYERVTFSYAGPGGPPQVREVSLSIPAGMFVGVVGQSGSGKSTLLKLLPRLYEPESGRILVDGFDVTKVEMASLRQQIGVVLQDTLLFEGTVQENIALADPEAPAEAVVEAARLACAHDFIMRLPEGYATRVGEAGRALSNGQRQRVVLARMILTRPRLLILDEATSALDAPTEQEILRNLAAAFRGRTIFLVTHRLAALREAGRILYLENGVLTESGSHEELLRRDGSYAALFRQQEAGK